MCGISALFSTEPTMDIYDVLCKSIDEISHRGPDGRGILLGLGSEPLPQGKVHLANWGLGHVRLSILDLSSAGQQPMSDEKKRYWITYNGEIYNYLELRNDLEQLGYPFKSHSDTEVVLTAYAEWGTDCFAKFRGMWGMVIFDTLRKEAIVCRDRLGIKPLYFWPGSSMLAVVSEIKQLYQVPSFSPRMNHHSVAEYINTGYEDNLRCFFKDVHPVPPGTWLRIPLDSLKPSSPSEFWNPEVIQPTIFDSKNAAALFSEKLGETVKLHLRSDVPVGCALSGGLDSSAIAVLVNKFRDSNDGPFHTFTCTFPGKKIDESKYSQAITSRISATPHFVTPTEDGFLEDFDRFTWMHDEPVGSISVYASYCIARLTRQTGIKVTLNGQGGDEILSGYWQSYFMCLLHLAREGRFLQIIKHGAGSLMPWGNGKLIAQIPVMLKRFLYKRNSSSLMNFKNIKSDESIGILNSVMALSPEEFRLSQIRSLFLPSLLKWDDRNSMAFSMEGRYPFLDHQLIELCLSFSESVLYSSGWTKWPLRVGFKDVMPQEILFRRSKFGFEVPQASWLAGQLKPLITSCLKNDGPLWDLIEKKDVRKLAEGRANANEAQLLFRLLALDRWLKLFKIKT